MKRRRDPQDVAVFTRNHRNYLEEAADLSAHDPRVRRVEPHTPR